MHHHPSGGVLSFVLSFLCVVTHAGMAPYVTRDVSLPKSTSLTPNSILVQDLQSCGAEEEEGQEEQGILRRLCGKVNPSLLACSDRLIHRQI
jgi:hypothetical protein